MSLRRIDAIKTILYPAAEEKNRIVAKYISQEHKHLIPYYDESDLTTKISTLQIEGYNSKDVVVLGSFQGRVFQQCPCSSGVVPCRYFVINTCFGCLYNCTYCFLNSYLNSFGLRQCINIDSIMESLRRQTPSDNSVLRIGTGEFTDSLMYDEISGIAELIINEMSNKPRIMVEFKTKSNNIDHLLSIPKKGNAVISWSLNTKKNIELYEEGTSSFNERIESAAKAVKHGYLVSFHFDPIILSEDCVDEYQLVINDLFSAIDPAYIAWISLGCFRFSPGFNDAIQAQFPSERLTTEELFQSFDGKFRYLKQKRVALYQCFYEKICEYRPRVPVYLCMEQLDVWNSVFQREVRVGSEYINDLHSALVHNLSRLGRL